MNIYYEYDKLLKYCYMKTHDSFLTEDLVQESFEIQSSRKTIYLLICQRVFEFFGFNVFLYVVYVVKHSG